MTDASQPPSSRTVQFGIAGIADGLVAYGLKPLEDSHISAIEARGLDPELLVMNGVGSSDRLRGDCIGIPYFDQGIRVGTKYRTFGPAKAFTQDMDSRQIFWNIDCLRDETLRQEPLIITEGEMDAFAAIQSGFLRTVSVPGGAPSQASDNDSGKKYQFLSEAESLLRDIREIILCVDGDGPGANLLHDLSIRLGRYRCRWVRYPLGKGGARLKDLNDALRVYGEAAVQQTIRRAQWIALSGVHRMTDLPPVEDAPGLDIGIEGLENHYRMRRGDFCIVSGIPGHGKTSMVNQVCCEMAVRHGWNTVFASFEQPPQTAHRRALRSFHSRRRVVEMNGEQIAAADKWIDRHFSFIVRDSDDEDADLAWVLERCAAAIVQYGASIVVIDPWNEMDHTRPPDMTLTEYTGFAIKQFRKLANKHRVHVIVVAHPAKMMRAKDGKYPVPTLYDISDSAHWANKADVGIIVHRDSMVLGSDTRIRIVKSRYHDQIGRPGEIVGVWDIDSTRYRMTASSEERGVEI